MSAAELLVVACLMLAVTACSVLLFRQVGLGSILGFLLVGIAVGPHTPGFVLTDDVTALREFTEIGVALLLFVIGLEMQPRRLWSLRRTVFGLGAAQVGVTTAALAALGTAFSVDRGTSLVFGFALALSSTAMVMQVLEERGEVATAHGRDAFGVLLFQDLAVIPALAAIPLLGRASEPAPSPLAGLVQVAVIAGIWVCGRWLVPLGLAQSARSRSLEAFSMFSLLAAFGGAWATHAAGGSLALGAFVMGMALSDSPFRHQVEVALDPFKALLLGFFFIAVGMSIDVSRAAAQAGATLLGVGVLLGAKVAIVLALGRAFGRTAPVRTRTAFLLAQGGEFGFVLLGLAAAAGAISTARFEDGVLVIALSMLVTPLAARLGDRLARRREEAGRRASGDVEVAATGHVIVAGYGRVGEAVCRMLAACDVAFVAFDVDPDRVECGPLHGHDVRHGDLLDARALAAAGAARATAIVVTPADARSAERLVSTVRHFYADLPVLARARDLEERDRLLGRGANAAVPVAAESSLQLGAATLRALRFAEDDVRRTLDSMRHGDYALLRSARGARAEPKR